MPYNQYDEFQSWYQTNYDKLDNMSMAMSNVPGKMGDKLRLQNENYKSQLERIYQRKMQDYYQNPESAYYVKMRNVLQRGNNLTPNLAIAQAAIKGGSGALDSEMIKAMESRNKEDIDRIVGNTFAQGQQNSISLMGLISQQTQQERAMLKESIAQREANSFNPGKLLQGVISGGLGVLTGGVAAGAGDWLSEYLFGGSGDIASGAVQTGMITQAKRR